MQLDAEVPLPPYLATSSDKVTSITLENRRGVWTPRDVVGTWPAISFSLMETALKQLSLSN